jgi:ferredoxin
LSFEEGGNPVVSNRILAGRDPLLLDSYCAELIGYHPDDIEYLTFGKKIGVGKYYTNDTEIIELNTENKSTVDTRGLYAAERYRRLIDEDAACSACYSSLVYALHRVGGRARKDEKLHIGQGFKGKSGKGIGIGTCAQGFSKCVKGCPPKATDIIKVLT